MEESTTTEKVRPLARGTLRLQSDERLLKLFRRGVEPAFEELVRRYRDALVAYAGSIAGWDRAEDVVQDSLVKAHRSLDTDREIEPRPWLYTVVRNTALNDIRDNRKHRHDDLGDPAGAASTPADLVEQRERFAAVLAAVADLPPAQRRALVDHELSGFSHEEIAAELDLSTGATKQLIYRARLSLRNAFGAMIPLPLVAWLVEGSGVVATGAAGGGATATGVLGSLGGGGAAKLAVVAVVAGGSLAGGIAVEKHRAEKERDRPEVAQAAEPSQLADVDGAETVSDVIAEDSSADTKTVEAGAEAGELKDRRRGEDSDRRDSGDRDEDRGSDRHDRDENSTEWDRNGHGGGGGGADRPATTGPQPEREGDRGGQGGPAHGDRPERGDRDESSGHDGDSDSGRHEDGGGYRPSGSSGSGPGPSGGSGGYHPDSGDSDDWDGSGGSGTSGSGSDGSGSSGSDGSGTSGSGSSGGSYTPPDDDSADHD